MSVRIVYMMRRRRSGKGTEQGMLIGNIRSRIVRGDDEKDDVGGGG